jgi:hypothetical protein
MLGPQLTIEMVGARRGFGPRGKHFDEGRCSAYINDVGTSDTTHGF